MIESFEKYPGVAPLRLFSCLLLNLDPKRVPPFVNYTKNLQKMGLADELYWDLAEERKLSNMLSWDQEEEHIAEWVDKLSNHPELLSDAEKEWVKNNPEYKEIIIMEE